MVGNEHWQVLILLGISQDENQEKKFGFMRFSKKLKCLPNSLSQIKTLSTYIL